jgi:RimJ/RimL family protein N-acetyltransferase
MTLLRTERLVIRNWRDSDRAFFHRINSDDRIMEYFPFRRSREQSDALMDEMCADIDADGYGWTAVDVTETGKCIGFVGLKATEIAGIVPAQSHEIGWRLAPEYWGYGYVTEAATALVDFAFDRVGLPEVISFAVASNARSIAVMERLGMRYDRDFIHPAIPDTHSELKHFKLYRLAMDAWKARSHGDR